ncbi:MAG: glycosyltransferase, partial [Syntrophaceae bacterium]|nr:glycosyltransferase [Syntrophaceae bacterium]
MTSIIILTNNQLELTKKCIRSIRKHTPEDHEIIFVDNGSTDGTVKWLQGQLMENKNYRLLANKETVGPAKGRNQGINLSQGQFILLLDNETIVSQGWLSGMLSCLNQAPAAGIIGPMTNNCNGLQQVTDTSYQSVNFLDKFAGNFREQNRNRRIPYRNIAGFCMLFRKTLIDKIGLFDESLGSGCFEDEDFCWRSALDDYQNYICGDVFIHRNTAKESCVDRSIIDKKWTLSTSSVEGKKLALLKATEIADTYYSKGKFDQGVETLINCIKLTPEAKKIYHELTRFFLETKKFPEAWEVIATMPEAVKNELKGLECAGYAKEGLGLDNVAAILADRMLSLNENYPPALNLKGVLSFKINKKDEAQNYFRKAIDADPGYGEAYTNLGVLYWGIGQKNESFVYLKKGFNLSPTVPDINSIYYSVVSSLGMLSDAEAEFSEYCRLYPHNKNLVFLYIDILIRQNKLAEAMRKIEDAIVLFGPDEGTLNAALAVREKIGPLRIERGSNKNSLSLCMIVKNEERYLASCLNSLRDVVDEMIIVDTGSTDKTRDIAKLFGAKIFDFPWTGDFAVARNHSLSQSTGDWILIMDADEVISPLDHEELRTLVRRDHPSPAAYSIITRNYTNNVSIIGWTPNDGKYPEETRTGWMISGKVRLFPRRKDVFFVNPVHELVENS